MVERRGLFLALKRLGLIWGGDLPWLNSLVVVNKAKSKKTKEIPWPSIRQSCISCCVMSPGMSFAPSEGRRQMAEIDVAADPPLGPQPFDGGVHVDGVPGD